MRHVATFEDGTTLEMSVEDIMDTLEMDRLTDSIDEGDTHWVNEDLIDLFALKNDSKWITQNDRFEHA